MGESEPGEDWLLQAQALNSEEPAISLSLALGYNSLGQMEERDNQLNFTLQQLNTWLQTHPDDAGALYNRALVHQVREEYTSAILDYEAVLNKDETLYIAYLQLSKAHQNIGQFEDARHWLETAVTQADVLGIKAASAYLQLGSIFEQQDQLSQAREAYQQAIQLGPNVDRNYFHYALFLEKQGEMDAALLNLQKMVEVSFQKGWAYEQLGHFYIRRELYNNALIAFQQAINFESNSALLYTYLADAHYALGDVAAAPRRLAASHYTQ